MSKINQSSTLTIWSENQENLELSNISGEISTWDSYPRQQFGSYLWNQTSSYHTDPAIFLLDICQSEIKVYIHTKTCRWMFLGELFTITQN